MKINSPIVGKGSGKLGSTIMANIAGETIARQYNPNVSNPNSDSQQDTRARFKLLSQLGAILGPSLAIRKKGLVSARNIFTSINFSLASFNGTEAMIDMNHIQITDSARPMPDFSADRSSGTKIAVQLRSNSADKFDRVVYVGYVKSLMGELQLLGSAVVSTAGETGVFAGELPFSEDAVIIYCYGIKDVTASMTTKFGNLQAPTADQVARLVTASSENMAQANISRTKGLTLLVGVDTGSSEFDPIIFASASIGGKSILNTVAETVVITGDYAIAQFSAAYAPTEAEEVVGYFEVSEDGQNWERLSFPMYGVNGTIEQGFGKRFDTYYRFVCYQQGIRIYQSQLFKFVEE